MSSGGRKSYHPHPPVIRQKAIELANKGEKYKEISEKLGVPMGTLTYWFKGVISRSPTIPREVRYAAVRMVGEGRTLQEVRDELGLDSIYTIKNWLKK